ncbi:Protein of unknown function [Cotesia congregata]|uniref:Uncharacterized protein n=1 Tax=Cotesia congregata TaxID=51543 RepID=A0A8J2HG60_COTCN|nr:Protein of unknown function [Cotesia congregata]
MLNSVPKQIVLTLQSSPPFLLEIILAITIALLLAISLVTRLQYFLSHPLSSPPCEFLPEFQKYLPH